MIKSAFSFWTCLFCLVWSLSLTSCQFGIRDKARVQDLQRLAAICFESTNIHSTVDLAAAVRSRGIKLHGVGRKDPSMPTYHLVREYSGNQLNGVVSPQTIMIEETNIDPRDGIYVVLMDGSISRKASGSSGHRERPN